MLRKLINKFRKSLEYYKAIEGIVAFYCILDMLLKKEKLRLINIKGTKIFVRTNTSDLDVAISSMYHNEYDEIKCTNPKFIIDAGANIGTSAIFFSKKYPEAKIIAIEPEYGNFNMLMKNITKYKNIIPINAAIWGKLDKRVINNPNDDHWGYTILKEPNIANPKGQDIDCITIEFIMEKYNIIHIDLLKMDIEGGEKDVLENSSDWIENIEIITVELHDRIIMGCDRAFYLSTKNFKKFEKHGEKVTAYKN